MITGDQLKESLTKWDVVGAEHRIANWIRGGAEPQSLESNQIENRVLRASLDLAALAKQDLFEPDGAEDLLPTSLSRALGNLPQAEPDERYFCLALSAFSYAASGNFATGSVFARAALDTGAEQAALERWLLQWLADPRQSLKNGAPDALVDYAEALERALGSGLKVDFASAGGLLRKAFADIELSKRERFLALYWENVQQRVAAFSVAFVLRESKRYDAAYVAALRETAGPTFFPTQVKAIRDRGLLRRHENALVVLPTSTGKSLLGELAILGSISSGRPLGVYLAPYRALVDQLSRKMKRRLELVGIGCEVLRGGYLSQMNPEGFGSKRTVLVATPEAFDTLLRARPTLVEKIGCCVFDELHLIEQQGRGLVYEGLAGRMLRAQGASRARLVGLSPVITKTRSVADWLRVPDDLIVDSGWRPTARRLVIAGPDGYRRYFATGERAPAGHNAPIREDWVISEGLKHPIATAPARDAYHLIPGYDSAVLDNVTDVAVREHQRFGGAPVLVVVGRRNMARKLAERIGGRLPRLPEGDLSQRLADEVVGRFPELKSLALALRHGVAYHNAALPEWVRQQLEKSIEAKALRVVVATTTLAEGVDLPFRSVVLAEWKQYQFGENAPMSGLLFRNIAGRCGRAGAFAEGDTIIVDNPQRQQTSYGQRYQEYISRYVNPSQIELRPGCVRSLESQNGSVREDVVPQVESQFAAFLACLGESEQPVDEFVGSLLSGSASSVAGELATMLDSYVSEALQAGEFALLKQNSPLSLTEFGRASLPTGLSGRSLISLAKFLRGYSDSSEPVVGRARRRRLGIAWDPLLDQLLSAFEGGTLSVQELHQGEHHSVGRRGYPVKDSNLGMFVLGWVSGCPVADIVVDYLGPSERRSAAEWLQQADATASESLLDDLEQASVFCTSYVSQQWSWVLRAAVVTSAVANPALKDRLESLAACVEWGVPNRLAAELMSRGCPIGRVRVALIVRAFVAANNNGVHTLNSLAEWIGANRSALVGSLVGTYTPGVILDSDLDAVVQTVKSV